MHVRLTLGLSASQVVELPDDVAVRRIKEGSAIPARKPIERAVKKPREKRKK